MEKEDLRQAMRSLNPNANRDVVDLAIEVLLG